MRIAIACLVLCSGMLTAPVPAVAARRVALITEGTPGAPASHGLAQVKEALEASGLEVASVIGARITAPAGVKWARLRYRHVSQYEDYQTAEMSLDSATGLYKATIPASFIEPKWDLMYFVEVVDRDGAGRMYPDLERETPYVVVAVNR